MRLLRSIQLNWGLRPQTPGIYRFQARMACGGGGLSRLLPFRLLSRRSGCVPTFALSSAQVLPEWITSTSPRNDFSSNGDNPLNFLYHSMGSPHAMLTPLSLQPLAGTVRAFAASGY